MRIVRGPFAGQTGLCQMSGPERVAVLFEIMGSTRTVTARRRDVEPSLMSDPEATLTGRNGEPLNGRDGSPLRFVLNYSPIVNPSPDPRIDQILATLAEARKTHHGLIDDFRSVATNLTTVKESFAAAFTAINAKLDAALADDVEADAFREQIVAVRDEIQGKVGELVDLAAENTPAAGEPTAPHA